MFVPTLTSTGLPFSHSLTTSGGARSPIWPPKTRPTPQAVTATKYRSARFFIIDRQFVYPGGLKQEQTSPASKPASLQCRQNKSCRQRAALVEQARGNLNDRKLKSDNL